MSDYETWAKQAVEHARKMPSWDPDDDSDPNGWANLVGHHRDSTLLEESNWETVSQDMMERFPDDVEVARFRHWGVGWIEELMVRIYKPGTEEVTDAFKAAVDWQGAMENYPVASDEDYSRREYEATLENIQNEGGRLVADGAPEDWAEQVFSWLWDNNQSAVENQDDQGGYPTEQEIAEALKDLGYLDPDYEMDGLAIGLAGMMR